MQWATGSGSIADALTDKYMFVCISVYVYISK